MKLFEDCTAEEMPVFQRIVEGGSVANEDPTIVRQLVDRGLLSPFDDDETHLTVPAIVWNRWKRFRDPQPDITTAPGMDFLAKHVTGR